MGTDPIFLLYPHRLLSTFHLFTRILFVLFVLLFSFILLSPILRGINLSLSLPLFVFVRLSLFLIASLYFRLSLSLPLSDRWLTQLTAGDWKSVENN